MIKKYFVFLLCFISIPILISGCQAASSPDSDDDNVSNTVGIIEYGYITYFNLSMFTISTSVDGVKLAKDVNGNVTTYTFNNFNYSSTDTDAAANGTKIDTVSGTTETTVANLNFSNDDLGLSTITVNSSGPVGNQNSGTITINGTQKAYSEYTTYIQNNISVGR